jgi:hypothetical protein
MKQKLFLVVLLVAGFLMNTNAQDKSTGDQKITVVGQPLEVATSGGTLSSIYRQMIDGVESATGNRSSMNLSKSFKGESVSSEAEFEVPLDAKGINLNLGGSCKNGEIVIKIFLPGGEPYKTQKITSAADINWTTTLPFNDENSKKFKGNWKLKIEANNCEGRYNLNISTR